MTYLEVIDILKRIDEGGMTMAALLTDFQKVLDNEQSIKASLNAISIAELTKYTRKDSTRKKADYVNAVYSSLLHGFHVTEDGISYVMTGKTSYRDALIKAVMAQTPDDLFAYLKRRADRKAKHVAATTDPQTIEDFETFVRYKGRDALTPALRARYDELIAARTFDAQGREDERRRTIAKANLEGAEMSLHKTVHSKKGTDLWVVKLASRISAEAYRDLNGKAKRLGGWYSSYTKDGAVPGFQFTTEANAAQFMALQTGNVVKESEAEKKALTVADKLRAMADRWEAEGRESLNRDRKDNTHRRARMAASAEADAERKILNAILMRKVADALEKGDIKYLSKVNHWSQLSELLAILARSTRQRFNKEDTPDNERVANAELDIPYAVYPYPQMTKDLFGQIAHGIHKEKGFAMLAKRMARQYPKLKEGWAYYASPDSVDELRKIFSSAYWQREHKWHWLPDEVKRYDRLQAMGITNIQTLRTALRELAAIKSGVSALSPEEKRAKELKEAERKFIGRKESGFFPTGEDLAREAVALAEIEPGMKVLEPSAGLGHLADAIIDAHPDVDLDVVEWWQDMRAFLEKKGHNVVSGDIFELNAPIYDRIIMNPPFEKNADIEHVRHCFNLLKPGGRLVAIMAANKDGSRGVMEDWRTFVDEYGYSTPNPEGAFKSAFRPTGVRTITVVLDKPQGAPIAQPAAQPDKLKIARAKAAAQAQRLRLLELNIE